MSNHIGLGALLFASAVLGACGGGGSGIRRDASTTGDMSMGGNGLPDLRQAASPDLSMAEGPPDLTMNGNGNCTANAGYGAVGPVVGGAMAGQDANGNDLVQWYGSLENMQTGDIVGLELYAGSGAFKGSATLKTGTFQIAGDELNYETCGVCVLVYTDVDAQGASKDAYMATAGTVTLTSVAGQITGKITNAKFQHVQIDPNSFHSTPDPSGCTSAVTSVSFDDPIM